MDYLTQIHSIMWTLKMKVLILSDNFYGHCLSSPENSVFLVIDIPINEMNSPYLLNSF